MQYFDSVWDALDMPGYKSPTCYPLAIEPGDDVTAFGATIPDIDGATSAGDTRHEARRNAIEAAHIVLHHRIASGEPWPPVGKTSDHQQAAPFCNGGWEWELVQIDPDCDPHFQENVRRRIMTRLPPVTALDVAVQDFGFRPPRGMDKRLHRNHLRVSDDTYLGGVLGTSPGYWFRLTHACRV